MIDTYPSLTGNWNFPTKMRFGAGRIKELAEACGAAESSARCWSPIRA